ncbi:MAG: hypothetical protein ACRDZW_06070, partial [Acidimicrobiales bacterium]
MSGEQQLERSVLENKERDELQAIAEAMGLKPTSRVAKSTLVGQILRATGVEVEANGTATATAPRRNTRAARTPRPSLNGQATPDEAGEAPLDAPPASSPAEVDSSPEPVAAAAPPAGDDGPSESGTDDALATAAEASSSTAGPTNSPSQGFHQQQQPRPSQGPSRSWDNGPADGPGNRRSRRRRGRDRDRPGFVPGGGGGGPVERDLQGGGAETQFSGEPVPVTGLLDLNDQGYGFLRTNGYLSSPGDVYVSISQVRRFGLRKGDHLEGASRPAGTAEKYPALLRVDTVGGLTPDEAKARPRFEDLTPLFPDQK